MVRNASLRNMRKLDKWTTKEDKKMRRYQHYYYLLWATIPEDRFIDFHTH